MVAEYKSKSRHGRIAACVLLVALLVTAFGFYRDYGISWDEPVQRNYGKTVYAYVFNGDGSLLSDRHRVYGPVFEVFLVILEKTLGFEDTQDVYFMRHLVTFLMFAAGAVFLYLLASRILRSWKLGLLGASLMVLTPRIFAHAFYNSKDIPFMAMFTVCMYTLVVYLDAGRRRMALLHGLCCAILVDMRVMGIFVPALTLGFFVYDIARGGGEGRRPPEVALEFGLFCAALIPLTILLWPTLWSNPPGHLIEAFQAMRKFAWHATVLFMGKEVWSTDLPPHYTPVWIGVTVPIVYLALGIVGMAVAIARLAGRRLRPAVRRRDALLMLIWLIVPLGFLMTLGAVLYDTWRHIFFVYPALLLLGLMALQWLWHLLWSEVGGAKGRSCAGALAVFLAVNILSAASFMARSHPHQNVYFNSLVGGVRGAAGEFEMDYWGLSYRKLLENLLDQDSRPEIRIKALNEPGYYSSFMLAISERRRLQYLDEISESDYYVTNFRWDRMDPLPWSEAVRVEVDGTTLSAAYRVRYSRE